MTATQRGNAADRIFYFSPGAGKLRGSFAFKQAELRFADQELSLQRTSPDRKNFLQIAPK